MGLEIAIFGNYLENPFTNPFGGPLDPIPDSRPLLKAKYPRGVPAGRENVTIIISECKGYEILACAYQ